MGAHGLPQAAFEMLIDARTQDLYDDAPENLADLEAYAGGSRSSLLHLAATILAGGKDPESAEAAGHGGVALALVAILGAVTANAAREQAFLPDDLLAAHALDRATLAAGERPRELGTVLAELKTIARQHLAQALAAVEAVAPR